MLPAPLSWFKSAFVSQQLHRRRPYPVSFGPVHLDQHIVVADVIHPCTPLRYLTTPFSFTAEWCIVSPDD